MKYIHILFREAGVVNILLSFRQGWTRHNENTMKSWWLSFLNIYFWLISTLSFGVSSTGLFNVWGWREDLWSTGYETDMYCWCCLWLEHKYYWTEHDMNCYKCVNTQYKLWFIIFKNKYEFFYPQRPNDKNEILFMSIMWHIFDLFSFFTYIVHQHLEIGGTEQM